MIRTTLGGARVLLICALILFGLWSVLPNILEARPPDLFAPPAPLPTARQTLAGPTGPALQASTAMTLSLTDADLTRAAEPYFPQTYAGMTLMSPRIRVASGRVILSATARTFFGDSPFVASAVPSASDGRLILGVESATLGGVSLPEGVRTQIAQQLQAAIDAYTTSRVRVDEVTTGSGVITLKGTAVP